MGLPFNPIPKPSHRRNKPTAKQRGAISAATRMQLHERSHGICERCYSARATEAAHSIRRWRIEERTTVADLCHLCHDCHYYCDNNIAGRLFLEQFRQMRINAN
jgi:MinD superfamily P-loop ATPase